MGGIENGNGINSGMRLVANGVAVISGDRLLSGWIEQTGRLDHDQGLLSFVLPWIKPGAFVVDAGANIGTHTVAYKRAVGNTGEVLAFEPNPAAFECLAHNCPDCLLVNAGLSDKQGSTGIMLNLDNQGASFLEGGGEIPLVTLDQFELQGLDFMKLDIEGMELQALRGAARTIRAFKPIILCELNRSALARNKATYTDVIGFLTGNGYKLQLLGNDNLEMPQLDVMFMPVK